MGGVILWGVRKRGRIMYEHEKVIRFTAMEDVNEFVTAAGQCDFDIDVYGSHTLVDAKSLLGMLAMGLKKDLIVRYGENDNNFENVIDKFVVA